MSTTVFVSAETRDLLNAAKKAMGARSVDETIRRLLQGSTPDARALFEAHRDQVLEVCRRWGLRNLTAFGSRARGEARPDSDLDLVAEFPPGTSLFDLLHISDELAEAFGCPVDLGSTPRPGSRLAKHVEEEGVVLVAAPS